MHYIQVAVEILTITPCLPWRPISWYWFTRFRRKK